MSAGSLKVKIFDAKGTNLIPVAKSTVTVGSSSHCDVVLEHPSIQGEHVRAWLEGGRIWIQDLGTTGGTFLNGIRLPGLKPMLVRDLDVLKLGECPATLGLEANLVRAPVVKAHAPVEEVTLTDIKPSPPKDAELEKRREELAKVSRELAELKLQLQMGRLEKSSTEELRKEINGLREELRQLGEQRDKTADAIKRLDNERHKKISAVEAEIVDMKLKAERDIRDMRDSQGRKLGHWKVDAVAELNRRVHAINKQKQKSWATRPLSQDMIFEWESEMNLMFRRVLLEELAHGDSAPENTHTAISKPDVAEPPALVVAKSTTSASAANTSASTSATSTSARRKSKVRITADPFANRTVMIGAAIVCLLALGWLVKPYIGRSAVRNIASQPGVQTKPVPAPAVPRYQPRQTRVFKSTYTENVLYTENYTDTEMNADFRQRWMADFAKAARADNIDDKIISAVASKELQLIQDLQRLRDAIQPQQEAQGIVQMKAREAAFKKDLLTLLKTPQQVEKYQRLKRGFLTRNQAALARQTR